MNQKVQPPKIVVAALIRNQQGAVLLTKRKEHKPMAGYWEFPGGKLEPHESPKEALTRELLEEIGAHARVHQIYDVIFYRYPEFDILLLAFHCTLENEPKAIDVAEIAWVVPTDFIKYKVLPADGPLLKRLQEEYNH